MKRIKKAVLVITCAAMICCGAVAMSGCTDKEASDGGAQHEQAAEQTPGEKAGKTIKSRETFEECDGSGKKYEIVEYTDGTSEKIDL